MNITKLPALGLIGVVYIFCRSFGLISGAWLGGLIGKVEDKIRKYTGLGILSQAGLAIGLFLIVKQKFKGIGPLVNVFNEKSMFAGDYIGTAVITTVTSTSVFFEAVGPILTKFALSKAGEIKKEKL